MRCLYDRDGKPLTLDQWTHLNHDPKYKRVSETTLPWGGWVSTVWLGLDHNYSEDGPPLIFETMVFPSRDCFREIRCERYSTQAQACQGHRELVAEYYDYKPKAKKRKVTR